MTESQEELMTALKNKDMIAEGKEKAERQEQARKIQRERTAKKVFFHSN